MDKPYLLIFLVFFASATFLVNSNLAQNYLSIPLANAFVPVIEFDQSKYTWTDRVYITIIAPDQNANPNLIDDIGNGSSKIMIYVHGHVLDNYKLVETGVDTGIFTGYVILTGDPTLKGAVGVDGMGLNPTGAGPSGVGPVDGLIPSEKHDSISVLFELPTSQTINASAPIMWNAGKIKWLEDHYNVTGPGVLQITDPDMNLDPKVIDKLVTKVWSDSDPAGINLVMSETGEATGVFQGIVSFSTNQSSTSNRLHISLGDVVKAQYIDRTLPDPYTTNDQLNLTASTFIGATNHNEIYENIANVSIMPGAHFSNCANEFGCYDPTHIKVTPLTNVTWYNNDSVIHTITSGEPSGGGPKGSLFNSGMISPGESFSHTFSDIGNFSYFDTNYLWSTGIVTVVSVPTQLPNNYTGTEPAILKPDTHTISFPKVIRTYDGGTKFFTDPRPFDDNGNAIQTAFVKGVPIPLANFSMPAVISCTSTLMADSVLNQEGVFWEVIPSAPDTFGLSVNWTMPKGTVINPTSDPGGDSHIFYNPVNFHYQPGGKNIFFQIDYGVGNILDSTQRGWFMTIIDTASISSGPLASKSFNIISIPGISYRIDGWIEQPPLAYPTAFVGKISYYNSTTHRLEAKQLDPIPINLQLDPAYMKLFESFNDQYILPGSDVTLEKDNTTNPFIGLFTDTGNTFSRITYSNSRIVDMMSWGSPNPSMLATSVKILSPHVKTLPLSYSSFKDCSSIPRITHTSITPHFPHHSLGDLIPITLNAIVSDVDNGTRQIPAGTVHWSTTGNGQWVGSTASPPVTTCTLTSSSSSCSVTYVPSVSDDAVSFTAKYVDTTPIQIHGNSNDTTEPTLSLIVPTTIALDPPSGAHGSQSTITVNGLTPNTPLSVSFDGTNMFSTTQVADNTGKYIAMIQIPNTASDGSHSVEVTQGSKSISKNFIIPTPCSGCMACAAYGYTSPEIESIVDFRENKIMNTAAGFNFMTVFNAWYFSFSPFIANYETQHSWFQQLVKVSIYPLVGAIEVSEKPFSVLGGDYGVLATGLIVSSMIGAVYFSPFTMMMKPVMKNKFNVKYVLIILVAVFASLLLSIVIKNPSALMITMSLYVISIIAVSAILMAKLINILIHRFNKH